MATAGSPWESLRSPLAFRSRNAGSVLPTHPEVVARVSEVEAAIGTHPPARVSQGSSGSYFVHNGEGAIMAIFKPKDEEPYGDLNPKWKKWLHKNLFPCCFGRACLIANQGYLSEAAAFVVDQALGLGIVPPTNLVALSSPAFNYPDAAGRGESARLTLPRKVGSFQIFVQGYVDAQTFMDTHADELGDPDSPLARSFQSQFERLVVLDSIIRNTDRGTDNWLIRIVDEETRQVSIAAIDNGLAFPFKHPNGCRAYPFGWASLPQTQIPFSDAFAEELIPRLQAQRGWDELAFALSDVFELDPGFDDQSFESQLAVMRGQALNVLNALIARTSPAQLIDLPCLLVDSDLTQGGWSNPSVSDAITCVNFC